MRKDVQNLVLPVDFANYRDVQIVVDNLQNFVKRKVPIRFGLAPQSTTTQSVEQAKVVYHLLDTYGLGATMEYLEKVSAAILLSAGSSWLTTNADTDRPRSKDVGPDTIAL